MNLIEVKNLCVTYKTKFNSIYAVHDLSLEIKKGVSLGIIGESGSGKSTFAQAILKMHNPQTTDISGNINFLGTDILQMSEADFKTYRWKEVSAVFQKAMNNLSPVHKISTQFEDIYRIHYPQATRVEIKEHVLQLLRKVNLAERVYEAYPHQLSGGMLQRISIALSLLFNPSLLIMDEATTALDVITQSQILDEIIALEQDFDVTRLMITHDLSVVATSCSQILVLYAGEMMEIGSVRDVLKTPLHPYTQGLISSFPALRGELGTIGSIPGNLPDLSIKQEGCVFSSRCKACRDICTKLKPPTFCEGGHQVRCHLYTSSDIDIREGSTS